MTLPSNVSSSDFARALAEFEHALGKEWVFSSPEDIAPYTDSYSPFAVEPTLQLVSSAAVAPETVEQVQQVVRIANKYGIALYTFSTGRNLGYGGASPSQIGCVIVDLKRMNKVLEVNEEQAYVVVEPGLNFMELYRYFEEHDHPFMIATPEPGWGSPVGNALDHGISFVVGDNFATARGMEVVLANGEVLRTGMGALPDPHLWHSFPYGFGPYLNGLFSQSNFGIVTKMGFSLARKPEVQAQFTVSSGKSDDLKPMIATIQAMRNEGLLYLTSVSSPIRSPMGPPGKPMPEGSRRAIGLLARRDGGSASEWDELGREANLPVSVVTGSLRGPARIVEATLEYAKEQFAKIPGAQFHLDWSYKFPLDLETMVPELRPQFGVPSLWPFSSLAMGDTRHGMYFFSPVCQATADDLFALKQTIREVVLDHADEATRGPFLSWALCNSVYPKAFIFTFPIVITDDAATNKKNRDLFTKLVETCAAKGWGEYRGHIAFQSEVMDQYSHNNHVLRRFCETLKDAVDPNGILAPGKSGIWPKRMRDKKA
ncbi:p-cresol methylhydroxylase subunit [Novosphingobium sp. Rr 2-17]|uniref:FAD-binding oxidoreductase n=1 Tax=Novosphingobium sp. Rr 2-17 TaxID=555793 RepID=UPI0002699ED0|nr:FAD-binding oxidoreductase [Novosphingobium sp. Rr 2-17]EIZ79128.1 p-cresol methylhydroxylase subunit [Novosphingobium sp. Rr 2-17]